MRMRQWEEVQEVLLKFDLIMDGFKRLTKIEEWEVGAIYFFKKGRYKSDRPLKCIRVNVQDEIITFEDGINKEVFLSLKGQWPNRYTQES
jgi:hypothetical protein